MTNQEYLEEAWAKNRFPPGLSTPECFDYAFLAGAKAQLNSPLVKQMADGFDEILHDLDFIGVTETERAHIKICKEMLAAYRQAIGEKK